jgi:hypothetical protein
VDVVVRGRTPNVKAQTANVMKTPNAFYGADTVAGGAVLATLSFV